jgi:phosphatidylglycerol:prolipoprotein diacylglycerol transferase
MTAHAIFMVLGFLVAFLLARTRLDRLGVPERHQLDMGLIAVVLGLVGARLEYVIERWSQFFPPDTPTTSAQVLQAFNLNNGGMVWYGGALLAAAGMTAYWRWRRHPVLAGADGYLPAVLVGLAQGRIGCFLNGCCFGAHCDLPWAVDGRHPTQLYETAVCLALGLGLWRWTRTRRRDGAALLLGVGGYAVWRFIVETLRDHGPLVERSLFGLTLTTAQWISLGLALGALALVVVVLRPRRG